MSRLAVNPTRMELRQLKTRLKTAQRGYKLLKDKFDETVRRFMVLVRQNKQMREELDGELKDALNAFTAAKALTSQQSVFQAFCMGTEPAYVETSTQNVMGADVPALRLVRTQSAAPTYGFFGVALETDRAVEGLNRLMERLVKLAELEKTCNILAREIEKNRRRVSALENTVIPQIAETIKFIVMKLDENERSNTIRLIKTKAHLENENAEN